MICKISAGWKWFGLKGMWMGGGGAGVDRTVGTPHSEMQPRFWALGRLSGFIVPAVVEVRSISISARFRRTDEHLPNLFIDGNPCKSFRNCGIK